MRVLLLIIDMQNDFCRPDGALYVKGAEKDAERLGLFISKRQEKITNIVLTQDNHHVADISHPVFWEDRDGNFPAPFTEITSESIAKGDWKPRFEREKAISYVRNLEKQGEFRHVIWPEHCIIGSCGAAIVDEILEPVKTWAREGHYYDLVVKGTNPLTEHFGALRANIPIPGKPETRLNRALVDMLKVSDLILVAGEARSHCVANTIKQIMETGDIIKKVVLLEDCMSDVTGFESIALNIYENALKKGAKFASADKTDW